MDALVEAALVKVNGTVNAIFKLKESDYPSEEDLRKPEPERETLLDNSGRTYYEAVCLAVSRAMKTVDALRSALKTL